MVGRNTEWVTASGFARLVTMIYLQPSKLSCDVVHHQDVSELRGVRSIAAGRQLIHKVNVASILFDVVDNKQSQTKSN